MVFFVYIGGGPRALAFSFVVFFVSMLLQRLSYDTIDESMSSMGFFDEMPDGSGFYSRGQRGPHGRNRRQRRVQVQHSFWNTAFSYICLASLVVVLFFMAVLLLFHLRPDLRQRRLVRRVEGLLFRWTGRLEEWIQELLGHPRQGPRERVSNEEIQKLPRETFVGEDQLQKWSVSSLKDELKRLQRHAEMRMGFAGGSETREMQQLIKSGLGVEKAELVQAVLKARGGDSGISCAVCLSNYTNDEELRVLPCGHRFHCDCVLTLLIVLPLLRVEMTERLPSSSLYAMDEILQASQRAATNTTDYEQAVLKLIYYHNWFTGKLAECPGQGPSCSRFSMSHAFWFGIGGYSSSIEALRDYAMNLSLTEEQVHLWDETAKSQNDIFNYGTLPSNVLEILGSTWTTECTIYNEKYIGFSLLGFEAHPVECPTNLRYQEVERVMPRMMPAEQFQQWFFVSYFDLRPFVKTEAAYSIGTTAFVCVILCIASIFFTSSANVLVLAPVEKMMRKVELIRANPLKAMKIADDEFQREEMEKKKKANRKSWRDWLCKRRNPMDVLRPRPAKKVDSFFCKDFLLQHISDIIAFYKPRAVDSSGGFFQSFRIDGTKFNPDFRQIVSSARMVINFMLAGKLLGDAELLKIGTHGLEYIENVHYVPAKQSYAFTVRQHKPEDMVEQAYGYAFILAAHAAARTAGVAKDNTDVARVFDMLERKFWLPDKGAYLDTISAEGVVDNTYRGQNSNMHMCEALIAAFEATGEQRYLDRAEVLAETFASKLAAKGGGFVWEHYTVDFEIDWEYNKNDPSNIYRPWGFQPGHQIEWAKNLLNIHRHRPKFWMVNRAKELFDGAWDLSWDPVYGGLVYGFGPDRKWCDEEKYFWVQGESIATASLLFQDPLYVEKYVCLWQYCWEHWVDHEHGGWFCFKMSRDNKRFNDEKAIAGGKCDYHTLVSCVEALRPFLTEASEPMETVILEKTIIKLGSLLALGFGEAGANIVSSNMAGSNSGVNAMVEGSMVDCIVGIAKILNFSTATEVLQGKVMTFVNQIAEIVHGVVDECWGAVNKNDGDSFLIIWRLADLTSADVHQCGGDA
eukprot:symbB.v1.2.034573.t1/scaffold4486.1/size39079/2